MFISKEQADARLNEDRNRLRVPEGADINIKDEPPPPDPPDTSDEPAQELVSSLDRLDDVINLGGSRAHYKANRPAQKAIADTSLLVGPTIASKLFGLSGRQTDSYQAGDTDSHGVAIPELRSHIKKTKERIALIASIKLRRTLKSISNEKLDNIESPLDAGRLAKDLATVIDRMEPKGGAGGPAVQFHVYRPVVKTINEYKVVNVVSRKPTSDTEAGI